MRVIKQSTSGWGERENHLVSESRETSHFSMAISGESRTWKPAASARAERCRASITIGRRFQPESKARAKLKAVVVKLRFLRNG
jgi:hypothetical protein